MWIVYCSEALIWSVSKSTHCQQVYIPVSYPRHFQQQLTKKKYKFNKINIYFLLVKFLSGNKSQAGFAFARYRMNDQCSKLCGSDRLRTYFEFGFWITAGIFVFKLLTEISIRFVFVLVPSFDKFDKKTTRIYIMLARSKKNLKLRSCSYELCCPKLISQYLFACCM